MSRNLRSNLSLALSLLALLVAMSRTAYALGKGDVKSRHLAKNAVTTAKIKDGSVTAPKLAPGVGGVADGSITAGKLAAGAVGSAAVADRSLTLHDLGGGVTNQTTTLGSSISLAAGTCQSAWVDLVNPTPNGLVGSLVVGTVTTPSGGPVLNNAGYFFPTIVTETTQNGAVLHLGVCAGNAAQNIPAGSVARWSVIAP